MHANWKVFEARVKIRGYDDDEVCVPNNLRKICRPVKDDAVTGRSEIIAKLFPEAKWSRWRRRHHYLSTEPDSLL